MRAVTGSKCLSCAKLAKEVLRDGGTIPFCSDAGQRTVTINAFFTDEYVTKCSKFAPQPREGAGNSRMGSLRRQPKENE